MHSHAGAWERDKKEISILTKWIPAFAGMTNY